MEINMQECKTRINTLSGIESEIYARNSTINILLNIINAFLSVHKLEQAEIEAIQQALERENSYTQELASWLGTNLRLIPTDQPETTEGSN